LGRVPDYKLGAKEQPKHTSAWRAVAEGKTAGKGRRGREGCLAVIGRGVRACTSPHLWYFLLCQEGGSAGRCLPPTPQTSPVCAVLPEVSTLGSSPRGSQRSQMIDGLSKVMSKHGPWRRPVSPSKSPNPGAPQGHWARRCPAMGTRWHISAGGAPKAGPGRSKTNL